MSQVKNIAVVGAGGQAGSSIVKALLETSKFNVTALTREDSSSSFPPSVQVKKGDYKSPEFLASALQGQDALIITLAFGVPEEIQHRLIEAAAAAGVAYVIPNEYGSDTANPKILEAIPMLQTKTQYREKIQSLGKSSWIAVINGYWTDFSLAGGNTGINIKDRTARFYDEGNQKATTTSLPQLGRAVAKLLSLPPDDLAKFKNKHVYINSTDASQADHLRAVQKATGTTDSDWKITKIPVGEAIAGGMRKVKEGDYMGFVDVLYGASFKPGVGGQYKTDNHILGLEEEDFDVIVEGVVRDVLSKA